jgi:ABC-type Fe3+ transport system substrate-binding protein
MTAAFQKATGIPVKLDDNSTGPLLTQIEAAPDAAPGAGTAGLNRR